MMAMRRRQAERGLVGAVEGFHGDAFKHIPELGQLVDGSGQIFYLGISVKH